MMDTTTLFCAKCSRTTHFLSQVCTTCGVPMRGSTANADTVARAPRPVPAPATTGDLFG